MLYHWTEHIEWDLSGHVPEPSTRPVMSWTHSNAANIDDWKVFIQNDATDIMEGFTIFDSRTDSAMFDLQNLLFQPATDLSTNQSIRWFVQPVNNSMLGPRSTLVQFSISHMTLETRSTAPGVTSMSLKEVSYQTSTNRQDSLQIQHSIQLHAIRTCTIQEQSVLVVQDTIQGHPNVPQRSFQLI